MCVTDLCGAVKRFARWHGFVSRTDLLFCARLAVLLCSCWQGSGQGSAGELATEGPSESLVFVVTFLNSIVHLRACVRAYPKLCPFYTLMMPFYFYFFCGTEVNDGTDGQISTNIQTSLNMAFDRQRGLNFNAVSPENRFHNLPFSFSATCWDLESKDFFYKYILWNSYLILFHVHVLFKVAICFRFPFCV